MVPCLCLGIIFGSTSDPMSTLRLLRYGVGPQLLFYRVRACDFWLYPVHVVGNRNSPGASGTKRPGDVSPPSCEDPIRRFLSRPSPVRTVIRSKPRVAEPATVWRCHRTGSALDLPLSSGRATPGEAVVAP